MRGERVVRASIPVPHCFDVRYDRAGLRLVMSKREARELTPRAFKGESRSAYRLITPVKTHACENCKDRGDTSVEFSDFNEVREVFEEAIRSIEELSLIHI